MQKGFASFWINFVVLTLIIALAGGYLVWKNNVKGLVNGGNICTLEAKICPDGSTVGRSGPKCEFATCPNPTPTIQPTDNATSSAAVKGWITYTKGIVTFEYPESWNLKTAERSTLFDYGWWAGVSDGEFGANPKFAFSVELTKFDISNKIEEQDQGEESLINYYLSYNVNSTSSYGDFSPKQISKEVITFKGKRTYKYVFKLEEPKQLNFNQITIYYILNKPDLYVVTLHGKDQQLDKILTSLKLL